MCKALIIDLQDEAIVYKDIKTLETIGSQGAQMFPIQHVAIDNSLGKI